MNRRKALGVATAFPLAALLSRSTMGPVTPQDFGLSFNVNGDDTPAIQAAIDFACTARRPMQFPQLARAYRMGKVAIRAPIDIDLGGGRVDLHGLDAGFYLQGSIDDVSIANGEIHGDGILTSNHHGIYTSTLTDQTSTYERFSASGLTIRNVVNGLCLDGISNARLRGIEVSDTIGDLSRTGIGISFGKGGLTKCENISVSNCRLNRTSRHGLYVAGAKQVLVEKTSFVGHAPGATSTHGRSAFVVSRSQNVTARNLHFESCGDECIGVDDDEGGYTTDQVSLMDCTICNPRHVALRVGVAIPWQDKVVEVRNVHVTRLNLHMTATQTYPILIGEVANFTARDLKIINAGRAIGGLVRFTEDAPQRETILFDQIVANIPSSEYLFVIPTELLHGRLQLAIKHVSCPSGYPVVYESSAQITNPNLHIEGLVTMPRP